MRLAVKGAVLALLVAWSSGMASPRIDVAVGSTDVVLEGCGPPGRCWLLEGRVLTVEPARGAILVAVEMAWLPDLTRGLGRTLVLADDGTRFLPSGGDLTRVRPGDDVQIRAARVPGGGWRAVEVVLVDLD